MTENKFGERTPQLFWILYIKYYYWYYYLLLWALKIDQSWNAQHLNPPQTQTKCLQRNYIVKLVTVLVKINVAFMVETGID